MPILSQHLRAHQYLVFQSLFRLPEWDNHNRANEVVPGILFFRVPLVEVLLILSTHLHDIHKDLYAEGRDSYLVDFQKSGGDLEWRFG